MRRANGTGGISKLPPGRRARYAVRVSYPDPERPGKYRQRYIGYYATLKEAQAALEGVRPQDRPNGITLSDVYERWSARKLPKVAAATADSYAAVWQRMEPIANRLIADLRTDDLQEFIDSLSGSYSVGSISKTKVMLGQLYKYALEHDFVSKDYSQFVELPEPKPVQEKGTLSEEHIRRLKELAASGFPWADTVLILTYTGFRVSAFLALKPENYHDGCLQGGIKTAAGKNRMVPVHPVIQPYVEARLDGTYLIEKDGKPLNKDTYRYQFKPVMKEIGLPQATPHWCRYTMVSRLRQAGAPDLAVKRIIGHSDKDVTDHYTKTDIEYLREAVLLLQ